MKLFKNILILGSIVGLLYAIIQLVLKRLLKLTFDQSFVFFFSVLILSLTVVLVVFIEINNPTFRTFIYRLNKIKKVFFIFLSSILVLLHGLFITAFVTDIFLEKREVGFYSLGFFILVSLFCNVRFVYMLSETDLAIKKAT